MLGDGYEGGDGLGKEILEGSNAGALGINPDHIWLPGSSSCVCCGFWHVFNHGEISASSPGFDWHYGSSPVVLQVRIAGDMLPRSLGIAG